MTVTRVVPVDPGRKLVEMHWMVRNPSSEARILKVSFTGKLIGAELNGKCVEWTDDKGMPSMVAVKLPAGNGAANRAEALNRISRGGPTVSCPSGIFEKDKVANAGAERRDCQGRVGGFRADTLSHPTTGLINCVSKSTLSLSDVHELPAMLDRRESALAFAVGA
jgi:hypothetical protein